MGRTIIDFVFADLPTTRRREVMSGVAHYIAGVLDREAMVKIIESLWASAELQPGDRVQTLRGSMRGVIQRVLADGRVVWQADGSSVELTALPETLVKETQPSP